MHVIAVIPSKRAGLTVIAVATTAADRLAAELRVALGLDQKGQVG